MNLNMTHWKATVLGSGTPWNQSDELTCWFSGEYGLGVTTVRTIYSGRGAQQLCLHEYKTWNVLPLTCMTTDVDPFQQTPKVFTLGETPKVFVTCDQSSRRISTTLITLTFTRCGSEITGHVGSSENPMAVKFAGMKAHPVGAAPPQDPSVLCLISLHCYFWLTGGRDAALRNTTDTRADAGAE